MHSARVCTSNQVLAYQIALCLCKWTKPVHEVSNHEMQHKSPPASCWCAHILQWVVLMFLVLACSCGALVLVLFCGPWLPCKLCLLRSDPKPQWMQFHILELFFLVLVAVDLRITRRRCVSLRSPLNSESVTLQQKILLMGPL